MMNLIPTWIKWAVLGVIVSAAFGSGFYLGDRLKKVELLELKNDLATAQADQTTMWQGVINGTVKNYERKLRGIRSTLDIALNSLRDRPSRTVSPNPRVDCKGSTGAVLSREDAEFLTREAARADTYREGLASCYEVLDGLGK